MDNLEVAEVFRQIARILEIKNENQFRVRAYLRAAATIESLPKGIRTFIREEKLETIPGIGKDLAAKIKEICRSGGLKFYEDLKKSLPQGLLAMLDIPGLGPKTVSLLFRELKIKSIEELEKSAKDGQLLELEGVKEKTVANILSGIDLLKRGKERISLGQGLLIAEEILRTLCLDKESKQVLYAGSLRRMKETVRDIDILAISTKPKKTIEAFVKIKGVKKIFAQGKTRASIVDAEGIQVDLRVVAPRSFGAALLYFTGSKNFNIKLRRLALKKKLKINEYGLFSLKGKTEKFITGKKEEDIFKYLKLEPVPPELREDNGEIELALKNKLPALLNLADIKGDLHVHSDYSDGINSISEMASAAEKKGYEYIGICDHSQGLKIAGGLSLDDLKRKKREIEKLNRKSSSLRILFGAEVDVDSLGELDYPSKVLAEFDIVIAAVHSGFKQSRQQLTRRIIKACQNKYVKVIAHPTGRLWGARDPYDIDLREIFKACVDTATALEVNAFPDRLDLNDINCRQAKEMGVHLCINTDAHATAHLDYMRLGVATARRGWIEKEQCINTKSLESCLKP